MSPVKKQQLKVDEQASSLQDEIRKLHFKLRQKDQIVQEFKREAEEYTSTKSGKLTERSSKLVALLEKDNFSEESTKQQTDKIINLITSPDRIGDLNIDKISSSVLFTAQDLKKILTKKDEEIDKKVSLEEAKAKFEKEKEELRVQLDA